MTKVGILPDSPAFQGDRIFADKARDDVLERFRRLRERLGLLGAETHTVDLYQHGRCDILILSRIDYQLGQLLKCIRTNPNLAVIYTNNEPSWNCPITHPRIINRLPLNVFFTWDESLLDQYAAGRWSPVGGHPPIDLEDIPRQPFATRKFCCMVAGHKRGNFPGELYSARLELAQAIAREGHVMDIYGTGWDQSRNPFVIDHYRGVIGDKTPIIKQYKYAIAYENCVGEDGYITEKIFDCFAAGCVPVYLGADNIDKHVPLRAFIDARRFDSNTTLVEHLANIGEVEHGERLQAAAEYLRSPKYAEFTSEGYCRRMHRAVTSLQNACLRRSYFSVRSEAILSVLNNAAYLIKHIGKTRRFILDALMG